MTTFYLVRHGANDWLGRALAGRLPDVHLNAEGRAQAERIATRLAMKPIRRIFSSPMERCRETAAPLAEALGVPVQICEAINEVDFGEWQGAETHVLKSDERWRQWNAFRSAHILPGGETMVSIQARMANEMIRLRLAHRGEEIALFSHGDPIRAALCYWLGMPLERLHQLEVAPGSISPVQVDDWSATVAAINDCP